MAEAEDLLILASEGADLVGFYALAAQYSAVLQLNACVRRINRTCFTVLGGPHANTAAVRCSHHAFDYVVVSDQGGGGGELGFIEVLRRAKIGGGGETIIRVPSRVSGVRYQHDQWPLPARDLINMDSYHYHLDGERCTSIMTSAGCPFVCIYCCHWDGYRRMECKSPMRVQEEIASIRNAYGIRAFMFYDDEINLRPDFMDEFLPALHQAGIIWRAFFKNGPVLTQEPVFEAMAAAGCVQICTGAESADNNILKTVRKGVTVEDNSRFVRLAVKHGMKPKVFTQVGLPGETPETIEALRKWLINMASEGLVDADVTITTPYEGSPIFDHPGEYDVFFDACEITATVDAVLYKGIPGEYKSYVWHHQLSPDDIVAARQYIEDSFRQAAGLQVLGSHAVQPCG
jgi:radical SAM superfamily enzyme YgiQ (UPF0313 family)